jgi:hypothetical protein
MEKNKEKKRQIVKYFYKKNVTKNKKTQCMTKKMIL